MGQGLLESQPHVWSSGAGRLTDRAYAVGDPPAGARMVDDSPCPVRGTNTPLPFERPAPASFKRLLGGWPFTAPVAFSSVGPSSAPPSVDSSASVARAAAGRHQASRRPARSPA